MDEKEEQAYLRGERMAYWAMLLECLHNLGYEPTQDKDPRLEVARFVAEREAAIRELREVCGLHGDNDWPDNLHLSDIIEKHLGRHLGY